MKIRGSSERSTVPWNSGGMNPLEQFRGAIRSAGLNPPDMIEPDGNLHRFASNGKRSDNAGWYVFHDDGVCDHQIKHIVARAGGAAALAHAVADDFAAAKGDLVAINREVALDLDDQLAVGEAHAVARGGAEHVGVGGAG